MALNELPWLPIKPANYPTLKVKAPKGTNPLITKTTLVRAYFKNLCISHREPTETMFVVVELKESTKNDGFCS